MPHKLSEIAAHHQVSIRRSSLGWAFRALWKRAYSKASEWLGGGGLRGPMAGGRP
jgi:hypothetical protein